MIYLIWSMRYGAYSGANPWEAKGLEWETPSPPPTDNFSRRPRVTEPPYAYDREEPSVVNRSNP
jgi:cytochrome c oxidase subunit 1